MKSSNILASVVIPTFNRRSLLARVISPLLEDPSTGEVVVVDDGGNDGSFEFLKKWAEEEPRLLVIRQGNAGQSEARRRGIEASQFDIVVLLDDDVEAGPGLISGHVRWHLGSEDLVVLGYMPTVVLGPRRPGQAATILYATDYESTCSLYENDVCSIFTHLWAGNMSMKRASVLPLSDESEERLDFHEDLRFGLQCQDAGLEAVFDRSLSARHWHNRNLRHFLSDCRRSGRGRARLSLEYPRIADQMNPLTSYSARENFIARYLGSTTLRRLTAPIVMALSYVAGRLHAWRSEMISVRMLRLIETAYGFRRNGEVLPE